MSGHGAARRRSSAQAAQGGGGMSPAMLGGIVALVAIVGAVLAFALTQGWFHGEASVRHAISIAHMIAELRQA